MSAVNQILIEFGESIGISNLTLDARSKVRLVLDNEIIISISHLTEFPIPEITVVKFKPISFGYLDIFTQALRKSNFDMSPNFTMQYGINEGKIATAIRIPERFFSLNNLERALDTLLRQRSDIFLT